MFEIHHASIRTALDTVRTRQQAVLAEIRGQRQPVRPAPAGASAGLVRRLLARLRPEPAAALVGGVRRGA